MLKSRWKSRFRKQRLRSVVIGSSRESKQDLRSQVGIIPRGQEEWDEERMRGQEEWDEERMREQTSSAEVREKLFRIGGVRSGVIWGEERYDDLLESSLVILSEKRLRKAEKKEGHMVK